MNCKALIKTFGGFGSGHYVSIIFFLNGNERTFKPNLLICKCVSEKMSCT